MSGRGRWQGMITIVRLNWTFYVAAVLVVIASLWMFSPVSDRGVRLASGVALAISTSFLIGSLAVSHYVYDRSDLHRWAWLQRALSGADRRQFIFCLRALTKPRAPSARNSAKSDGSCSIISAQCI